MELTIETFPTKARMVTRKTELEAAEVRILYSGATGPATDAIVRAWNDEGKAKTKVVDLEQGFMLIVAPDVDV
jgi:hypothetical protein